MSGAAASDGLRESWWIAAIALLSGIGGGVVFPILPILGVQLGLSAVMVGLILAANRITRIFFNPFTGALIDRFGARWPVAVGLFLETAAVLAFSMALRSHVPAAWFLGGRVVWGVGSSLILVGALAAVMGIATRQTRGRLTGRVRTALTLGLPAGMVLGGGIADAVSSNAAFLTASGLTFLTGLFALYAMPRGSASPQPAEAGGHRGLGVWRQLLSMPVLQVICGANALIFFALSGVLLATLVVLVDARSLHVFGWGSQATAGVLMALLMLCRGAAAMISGSVLDRRSRRTALLIPSAVLTCAGFVGLDLAAQSWAVALSLVAIGLGSGALTIPLLTLISDAVPHQRQGRAMGMYQVYGDIGGSLGPIVGLQLGAMVGYGLIYLGVAGAMLVIIAPLYWLVRHERAQAAGA